MRQAWLATQDGVFRVDNGRAGLPGERSRGVMAAGTALARI